MNQLKKTVYFFLIFSISLLGFGCVKKHYTTQSKANTYNDYKATKYKMKNKPARRK